MFGGKGSVVLTSNGKHFHLYGGDATTDLAVEL
jgi:hypothetical protein